MGALLILQQWWYYDTNDANEVEDVVQRVMECHYLTTQDYEGCMELDCNDIIACLNDPESGVAQAIIDLIAAQNFDNLRDNAQSQNGVAMAGYANPTCDFDILYGQATQLVEYLNAINEDILEIFEVATNQAEIIGEVVGNITIIDETSIDAFISWVSQMQDSIAENYLAQVTEAYKLEMACEIFCRATFNNCAITPALLFDIFKERLEATVTIESLIWESLNYLTSGSWEGTEIADFLFFSQIAIRAQVGRIVGNVAWTDIEMRLAIYANDPDPDWSTACDECECTEVTETWDFSVDEYSEVWFPRASQAAQMEFIAGVGWRGDNPGGSQIVTERYSEITEVSITYTFTGTGETPTLFQYESSTGTITGTIGALDWTGDEVVDEDILVALFAPSGTFTATITSVTVTGCLRP